MNHFNIKIMKYKKEVNQMLRKAICTDYTNSTICEILISDTLHIFGTTKEKLSAQIEVGVKNGHSVEKQINLINAIVGRHESSGYSEAITDNYNENN